MSNVVAKFDLDDNIYREGESRYWENWSSKHPEPEVHWWRDDDVWQKNRDYFNDKGEPICPEHGVANNKVREGSIIAGGVNESQVAAYKNVYFHSCRYCLLQERMNNVPLADYDFRKTEKDKKRNPNGWNTYIYAILDLSRRGFKGNAIPKSAIEYENHLKWRLEKDKAAKQWTQYVSLHTSEFRQADTTTRIVADMIRDRSITLTNTEAK
jgi:hypothetical protein